MTGRERRRGEKEKGEERREALSVGLRGVRGRQRPRRGRKWEKESTGCVKEGVKQGGFRGTRGGGERPKYLNLDFSS